MKNGIFKLASVLFAIVISTNISVAQNYTDLDENHWAYNYIQMLSDEGVVVGYPDGTFKPNEYVTRAEFASMAIKGLKMQDYIVKEKINFADIPGNHWAYDQIQRAAYFDLIDVNDRTFDPEGSVTRGHAITVTVNALSTEDLSEEKALDILKKNYTDYYNVDSEYVIPAAKAKLLDLIVDVPNEKGIIAVNQPATRAELSAFLFKMIEAAKLNPNEKIAQAMPKIAEGIVLENVTIEGNIATIPAGTLIPVEIVQPFSTQTSTAGQVFLAKTPDNIVSKEKYLLLKKDNPIAGRILDLKKGIPVISNGRFNLETKTIKTDNDQLTNLAAISDVKIEHNGFWNKVWNFIIKNDRIELKEGNIISIKLLSPLKIDIGNGWIVE